MWDGDWGNSNSRRKNYWHYWVTLSVWAYAPGAGQCTNTATNPHRVGQIVGATGEPAAGMRCYQSLTASITVDSDNKGYRVRRCSH